MSDGEKNFVQKTLFDKESIRRNTDNITDKIDRQAIENIKTLQERRNYEEELLASLHRLNSHSICPGNLPTCEQQNYIESKKEEVKTVHGEDCHCSKCCPNPNPNFFQKNKQVILISLLWVAMIILAVGWSPSGEMFEAIQNSYVDLLVNFFKMGIFAVAGIVTYSLLKKKE